MPGTRHAALATKTARTCAKSSSHRAPGAGGLNSARARRAHADCTIVLARRCLRRRCLRRFRLRHRHLRRCLPSRQPHRPWCRRAGGWKRATTAALRPTASAGKPAGAVLSPCARAAQEFHRRGRPRPLRRRCRRCVRLRYLLTSPPCAATRAARSTTSARTEVTTITAPTTSCFLDIVTTERIAPTAAHAPCRPPRRGHRRPLHGRLLSRRRLHHRRSHRLRQCRHRLHRCHLPS